MKFLITAILLAAAAVIFLGWDPMGLGLFRGVAGTWVVDEEAMKSEEGDNLLLAVAARLTGGYGKVELHLGDDGRYSIEGVQGALRGEWAREGDKVTLSGLEAATYEAGRLTVALPIGVLIFKRK